MRLSPAHAKLPVTLPEHHCPLCGAPTATPVGPIYSGSAGLLWRRRTFEEKLFRCVEGHVFSVRIERARRGESVTTEGHESVEDWLRTRTGTEPSTRPPGL
jgi:hypothetical protein